MTFGSLNLDSSFQIFLEQRNQSQFKSIKLQAVNGLTHLGARLY